MKTLDQYITLGFLKNYGVAILSLTFLYFFQDLLGDLFNAEFSPYDIIFHKFYKIPLIFVQMNPPAVLLSTVITLSGLNRTNELVACYAIGVGLNRVFSVILSLVFMISCLSLVLQDQILPSFFRKATTFYWKEMKKKTDFFYDIKKDKIWYRTKNLIYNLRNFDSASKTIFGMSVYTFDENFNLVQMIDAERATYTPKGWKLMNGTVTLFPKDDPFPLTQKFEEKELVISESPKDFQEIEKEVDGLRLKELQRYIQKVKNAGADTKKYEVKLQSRISLSFIPLVMCFLAVPFSTGRRREGGLVKDLGLCMGLTFFYWLFYSIGLSLGTNGALPSWLGAWLPSAIFIALTVTLIARRQVN